MFTIKATYRNETRKFTFPDTNVFPSFHQLYLQLYRVFPISHNYYLSKLLFSPDSSKSRILLAREVHSAEEYDRSIAQYGGRSWANPLLKFSVYDETPHKLPSLSSMTDLRSSSESHSQASSTPRPYVPSSSSECSTSNYSPIPFAHIPPPPIIFSSIPSPVPSSLRSSEATPKPLSQQVPQHVDSPTLVPAAFLAELRTDMKHLDERVGQRLDEQMSRLNAIESKLKVLETETPRSKAPSPVPVGKSDQPDATAMFPPLCKYTFCVMCGSIKQGPWYDCQQCALKVCVDCNDRPSKYPCKDSNGHLSLQQPHMWIKQVCPTCPTAAPGTDIPVVNAAPAPAPDVDVPMKSPHIRAGPDGSSGHPPPVSAAVSTPAEPEPEMPVVHFGIRCDDCQIMPVRGVRHKCLDCPDYDLCTTCITSGAAERHNPFHEFIEINEPGRVVVHTVYSGNGERRSTESRRHTAPAAPPAPPQPVVHFASCNLCDSRIRGDRYKCLECPDYDTCEGCFDITPEHHPHHAFVKIKTLDQFLRRSTVDRPMHYATCNSCQKGIFGVRYKCMHPECPDFDLCDDCEALPIAVHPANHPLLKMKDANTVIPTVYRVGGTRLVDSPPARYGGRNEDFMGSLAKDETPRELSPELKPPSPFFFATDSERSASPPVANYRAPCAYPPPPAPIAEYRTPTFGPMSSQWHHNLFNSRPSYPLESPSPSSPQMRIPGALPTLPQLPPVPQVARWQPPESWHVPESPFTGSPGPDSPRTSPTRLPSPPRNWPLTFKVPSPPSPPRLPPIAVGMRVPTPPSPPPVPVPFRLPSPPLARKLPSPPSWSNYRVRFAATPPEPEQSFIEETQTRREIASSVEDTVASRVQLPAPPRFDPFSSPSVNNPFASHMSSYSPGFWHGGHLANERNIVKEKQEDEESSFEKDLLRALEASERLNQKRTPSPVTVPPRESPLVGELLNSPENTGKSVPTYTEMFKPSLIEFLVGPDFAQSVSLPTPEAPVEESPLIGDLLNRPASMVDRDECCSVCSKRSLASILDGPSVAKPEEAKEEVFVPPLDNEEDHFIPPSSRTLNALLPDDSFTPVTQLEAEPEPQPELRLDATFIDDRSVPDGQIFPPGAEFVKSWRMMNTGTKEWPEGTTLFFVGGDCLERIKNATASVGTAGVRESVDVWTGELKAPEREGRYVSYYRLRDSDGVVFGDSIWLDITVRETHPKEDDDKAESTSGSEAYKSLSSSSVIIMPTAAASMYATSSADGSSLPSSQDTISDAGSPASSVSLLSVPEDDEEDEDDEDWAETRESFASPHIQGEEAEEYVVLFEESD